MTRPVIPFAWSLGLKCFRRLRLSSTRTYGGHHKALLRYLAIIHVLAAVGQILITTAIHRAAAQSPAANYAVSGLVPALYGQLLLY